MEKSDVIVSVRSIIVKDSDILLVQRAENDWHNAGMWELPGGKVDAGQDITSTQVREIEEETSLLIEPDNSNVYLESSVIESGKYIGSTYISIVGLARVIAGRIKLSAEHDDFRWAHANRLLEYNLTDVSSAALRHFNFIQDDQPS
jgi:8-oxo-dGTP diphosphatase